MRACRKSNAALVLFRERSGDPANRSATSVLCEYVPRYTSAVAPVATMPEDVTSAGMMERNGSNASFLA
jgi:hypothetical protein